MPVFDYEFEVEAPVELVSAFHHDTSVLHRLTPPPVFLRIHRFGAMAEGMEAEFTMWVGPIPMRWEVVHMNVTERGFTDDARRGPLKKWTHTHRFEPRESGRSAVVEHIEYEHPAGVRGLLTRLMFSKPSLWGLFTYRRWVTRRGVRRMQLRDDR